MIITFSIFNMLFMIAVTQGLITSALLLLSKDKSHSIRLLGIIIVLYCIFSIKMLFLNSGPTDVVFIDFLMSDNVSFKSSFFVYLPIDNALFFPPLFACYISLLLKKDFKIQCLHLLHIIPGISFFIYDLCIYLMTFDVQSINEKNVIANSYYHASINLFENVIVIISGCGYLIYSYNKLKQYKDLIFEVSHEKHNPLYDWAKNIILWVCGFTIILFVNVILDLYGGDSTIMLAVWKVMYLYIAVFIYYLGFCGYKKKDSDIYSEKYSIESISKKHKMTGLDLIEEKIKYKFESDKVYLDPNLSISQLSESLGISNEKLSFVINKKFQVNFRDLLNSYRINLAKEKLLELENTHQTILSISYDSGFNSQASFYRAFKKFEGISPKNYIALNQ